MMAMDSKNCGALYGAGSKKKAGLLKDTPSRIGRVLKQNRIKDADNSIRERKLKRPPRTARPATDQLVS